MRAARIDAVIAALREAHPELRRPATWHGVRRVLKRLRIRVIFQPMRAEAKVLNMGGVAVVALNSDLPYRRHTYRLLHELGHVVLHGDDDGVVFNMTPCWPDDPREDDAEYFAAQLLGGPEFWRRRDRLAERPPDDHLSAALRRARGTIKRLSLPDTEAV